MPTEAQKERTRRIIAERRKAPPRVIGGGGGGGGRAPTPSKTVPHDFIGPLPPGVTREPAPTVPHDFIGPLQPGVTRDPAPSTSRGGGSSRGGGRTPSTVPSDFIGPLPPGTTREPTLTKDVTVSALRSPTGREDMEDSRTTTKTSRDVFTGDELLITETRGSGGRLIREVKNIETGEKKTTEYGTGFGGGSVGFLGEMITQKDEIEKHVKAAEPGAKIIFINGVASGIESPEMGQTIPITEASLNTFINRNIDTYLKNIKDKDILETSLSGISPISEFLPGLKKKMKDAPDFLIGKVQQEGFFKGIEVKEKRKTIKEYSSKYGFSKKDAGLWYNFEQRVGIPVDANKLTKQQVKDNLSFERSQLEKASILKGTAAAVLTSAERAKGGFELLSGVISKDKQKIIDAAERYKIARDIEIAKGKDIKKFLDVSGTAGAFFGGSLIGAPLKAATSVVGETLTQPPLAGLDTETKRRIEKQLELDKKLLIEAGIGAVQGAFIGLPTGGIVPKTGGTIKKVAGTLFSLEKPLFAIGEQDDFAMFQRINKKFADREDAIRKLELEKMKKTGVFGDIAAGAKIAEATVTKAAVGIVFPESEMEATLDLAIEGLIGTDIAKPAISKIQKLAGFGVGAGFGGQQIVSAERPSDILMGVSTGVLGLGGLKGAKADAKTGTKAGAEVKTAQERAFEKLKKEQIELEKIRKKRFDLLRGETGVRAKDGILTAEPLPQTVDIGNIVIAKGKKFSGKEIKILAGQLVDLGAAKTEVEAISMLSDAKIGAVKVKTRLPTELTIIKGSLGDIAKTVKLEPLKHSPGFGQAEAELGIIGISTKTPFGTKEINYVAQIGRGGKMSVRGELQVLSTDKKGKSGIIIPFKKAPPRKRDIPIPGQPPLKVEEFGRVIEGKPTIIEFGKTESVKPIEGLTIRESEAIFKKIKPFSKGKGVSQEKIFKELEKIYTPKELKALSKKGVPIEKQKIREFIIEGKSKQSDLLIEALVGKDYGMLKATAGKESPFLQISKAETFGISPVGIDIAKLKAIELKVKKKIKKTRSTKAFTKTETEIKAEKKKNTLVKQQEKIRKDNQKLLMEAPVASQKIELLMEAPSGLLAIPKEFKLKAVEKTRPGLIKKKSLSEAFHKMNIKTSKIGQEFKMKIESKLKPQLKEASIIKQQLIPKMDIKSIQEIKTKQDIRQELDIKTQQKLQTKLQQKLQPKLQQKFDIKTDFKTDIKTDIKITPPKKEKLKPKTPKKKPSLTPKKEFYMPQAKRNEKWVNLAKKGLTKQAAKGRGARVVDNTIAAAFRIKPIKKGNPKVMDNYFAFNKKKFRGYKIVKGKKVPVVDKFFERRGVSRIDSTGEKEGLTISKFLKRKGWAGKKKTKASKVMKRSLEVPKDIAKALRGKI